MTLSQRREKFAKLSIKVGILFSKLGLSPNQWTLFSAVPLLLTFYFLWQREFLFAAALFAITSFLDLVDGSVARVTGRVTRFGAYLDTIVDRYMESVVILGLLLAGLPDVHGPTVFWLFGALVGSMMTTYAKAAAKEKNLVEKELRGGILERPDRMILLFAGILAGTIARAYTSWVVIAFAVLSNVSALQRIWAVWRQAKK